MSCIPVLHESQNQDGTNQDEQTRTGRTNQRTNKPDEQTRTEQTRTDGTDPNAFSSSRPTHIGFGGQVLRFRGQRFRGQRFRGQTGLPLSRKRSSVNSRESVSSGLSTKLHVLPGDQVNHLRHLAQYTAPATTAYRDRLSMSASAMRRKPRSAARDSDTSSRARFRGLILAVEFSNRLCRVSTAERPQRRRRVNRGRLPLPHSYCRPTSLLGQLY